MKAFSFFILFVPFIGLSQSATFMEIKVKPSSENYRVDSATIVYPVILLHNKTVANKINRSIKKKIADPYLEDSTLIIDSALQYAAASGLTGISYEIMFNKNGVLSFILWLEGMGAYPTSWKETMTLDLTSGNTITLKEILATGKFDGFQKQVYHDKIKALSKYKKELRQRLDDKEIEKQDYDWALQEVNEYCLKSVSFEKFILNNTGIEIFDECEFPHVIQALGPAYDLKYKLSFLKPFLKQKILRQLTQ